MCSYIQSLYMSHPPSLVSFVASFFNSNIASRPAFCYIMSIYPCTKQAILVRHVNIGDEEGVLVLPSVCKTTVISYIYNPHCTHFICTETGTEENQGVRDGVYSEQ